ncbi:MAG: hypothetical protein U0904_08525 [Candidatus Nanopelagicales bacterium]|nr:hypothetical protein [Candidatus Nanopelagicales bacterium]
MATVFVLGAVLTTVALLGLLGRTSTGREGTSQIVVYALPLGLLAGGYAASIGMNLMWAVIVAVSILLGVLAGGWLGRQPALDDVASHPAAAGLSLVCSGLISVGLAAVAIMWAGSVIAAFSYLNHVVVAIVLALAAVAYAAGRGAAVGLSRTVLVLLVVGAVGLVAAGYLAGDFKGLGSPYVSFPPVPLERGILYAIGIVLIGAGYPVLRGLGSEERGRTVKAAITLAVIVLVSLVGMLAIYGGAFNLPSLVINIFPVYTPPLLSAVISGLVAVVGVVAGGAAIRAAGSCVAPAHPKWCDGGEFRPTPGLLVALVIGVVAIVVSVLAPTPTVTVTLLAILAVVNLIAERMISRGRQPGRAAPEAEQAARSTQ